MGQLFKLLHFITNVKIEEGGTLHFLNNDRSSFARNDNPFLSINSIPASQILVQHLTLWIGFVGAVLAKTKQTIGT